MSGTTYELQVTLQFTPGKIWRRIRVPGDTDLASLHHILQQVMGWQSYHLYAFECGGWIYGEADAGHPGDHCDGQASQVTLEDLLPDCGDTMMYHYDPDDNWMHLITVQDILSEPIWDPICLDGAGACPPEGCGGPLGYYRLLHALNDANQSEHAEAVLELGGDFCPDDFDIDAVNWNLQSGREMCGEYPYCIDNLIEDFLLHESERVAHTTYQKYRRCMDTLRSALNSYGYLHSDINIDSVEYAGETFCQVAGLTPLLIYLPEFFDYYLARKSSATVSELKEQRTTVRRFLQWLADGNMIDPETASEQRRKVLELAREAINTARVRDRVSTPVEFPRPDQVDDLIEDHFTIVRVEPGQLWLEHVGNQGGSIAVRAPSTFTHLCQPGMDLSAELQLSGERWYLAYVYNAYPRV